MKGFLKFTTGMMLGFCIVQGFAYLNQHYLWTLFYHW